jgi:hypothetical protein
MHNDQIKNGFDFKTIATVVDLTFKATNKDNTIDYTIEKRIIKTTNEK